MKIAIKTLGCKVNQSESASIEGLLRENDYEIAAQNETADVFIINTCSVTAKSDRQSRQLIRNAAKSGAKVIATGCYAQLRPEELTRVNGLSYVVGNAGKEKLMYFLDKLSNHKTINDNSDECMVSVDSPSSKLTSQPYYSSRSRAFLKLQDGCNFSCSYCTVPLARGRSRSLRPADVISSTEKLAAHGYKEIVLTGIHTGLYGLDLSPRVSLPDMITDLSECFPDIRIRLSSLEPQEISEDIINLIKNRVICPHLHIPVQSGSDRILTSMNRGYAADFFEQLVNRIVTAYPEISIGTDVIAGFPGETDNEFNDTVKLIERLSLSYLHVFPYSRRPDTRASRFSNQISEKVRKERVKSLIDIGNLKKKAYISKHLGRIVDVIVEQKSSSNSYYKAISDNYLRILVKSGHIYPGQRLKVRVTSLTDSGLIAEPLK